MMEHHEICLLVPGMTDKQYATLRDDIQANGLGTDIVLYEGAILDGRHRHRACLELGIEPRFMTYEGTDPTGFVFSNNIAHRHLEKGQLAMAGAKLKGYFAAKAKERQSAAGKERHGQLPANLPEADSGNARDQAAEKVGVSGRSVTMAENIIRLGVPRLAERVLDGSISLHKGQVIASFSKPRQTEIAAMDSKAQINAAMKDSVSKRAARAPKAKPDNLPGTQLVRVLLSRLELITNEMSSGGFDPESYSKAFTEEFDWQSPLLVDRLAHAHAAIAAIAPLLLMARQAEKQAA